MKYNRYPSRDAIRNYFPLPNEIFQLGLTPGTELFSRKYTERYKKVNLTVGGVTSEYYVYNEKNGFGNKSAYSVSNLEINPKILHDNTLIPLNGADGKVDYEKAKEWVLK